MAFKFKTFAAVGALIGSLALVGCGQDEKDPNHIKVGVIVGQMVGRQLPFLTIIVLFWIMAIMDGWRGIKETWPAVVVRR